MYAVCIPLGLFPFELYLRTITGHKSKCAEGTNDASAQLSSICHTNTVTTANSKSLNSSFSASKRKIMLLIYFIRQLQHYSDYWKIRFVNSFEIVTLHLLSSIRGISILNLLINEAKNHRVSYF